MYLLISFDLHVRISEADVSQSSWCAVAAADRQPVPALKDGAGWHIFCLGYVDDEDIAGALASQSVTLAGGGGGGGGVGGGHCAPHPFDSCGMLKRGMLE